METVKIDVKNLEISEEQAETFAYNIFKDIGEYIKQHTDEFISWNTKNNISKCHLHL